MTPRGQVYDLIRYGATPGDRAATVNAAIDRLRDERGDLRGATIELPAADQPYYADRPILPDDDRVTFRGDGDGATRLNTTGSFPALALGVSRAPGGKTLDADRYLPLAGRLDPSVPPGKRGLDLRSDTHLAFCAEAFDTGDRTQWRGLRAITLDFALEWPDGQRNAIVCGVGDPTGTASPGPRPLIVWSSAAGRYRVDFRTRGRDGAITYRYAYVPAPSGTVHRISVSIDLDRAAIVAHADGKAVEVQAVGRLSPRDGWVPNGGLSFHENPWMPFLVGGAGRFSYTRGEHPDSTGPIRLLGFRLGRGVRYDTAADGAQLLGGSPATDFDRFFRPAADTIGLLPLDQADPGPDGGRLVRVAHGPGISEGYGYWVHSGAQGGGYRPVGRTTIRDLAIQAGGAYGQGIAVGTCVELRLSDLTATGGWHGVGSLCVGPAYPIWMRDVRLWGSDASIFGNSWKLAVNGLYGGWPGRTGLRFACGGDYVIRDAFFSSSGTAETVADIHGGELGGDYLFENFEQNGESPGYPSAAGFRVENGYSNRTALTLRKARLCVLGPDADAVRLLDRPDGATGGRYDPATVHAEDFEILGSRHQAQVATDGPLWRGDVPFRTTEAGRRVPAARHTGVGTSNVRVGEEGD